MRTRKGKVTDLIDLKENFTYTKGFNINTFNSNYLYVVEDNKKIIAYLYGDKTENSRTSILYGVEVLEEYRNKKIATRLIKKFEKDLKEDNCGSILVFYNKYDGLDKFYKKVGFEIGINLVTGLKDI